jgi:hypothetical protein
MITNFVLYYNLPIEGKKPQADKYILKRMVNARILSIYRVLGYIAGFIYCISKEIKLAILA